VDFGLSASSVPRSTKVPEGAAHHTANFRAVNTSPHPALSPPHPCVQPLKGVPVSGARIVHTLDKNGKWGVENFLQPASTAACFAATCDAWRRLLEYEPNTRKRALSNGEHAFEPRRKDTLRVFDYFAIDAHGPFLELAVGL